MIDFLATEPHYAEHLRPVYDALPEDVRGRFARSPRELRAPGTLTVVASWRDYQNTRGPVAFFEHGAGFTYNSPNRSYAGAGGRDRVRLFANVNEHVDAMNRAAYPNARHAIVGAPKLDALTKLRAPGTRRVAFSWHWDCHVVPETRTAFPHYTDVLADVPGEWQPIGHAHPRAWSFARPRYEELGWEIAETFADVVALADVYVCDTSSTLYEFAALDRPVIVLNAPWYRRDVGHGLRFWRDVPGVQVNEPGQFVPLVDEVRRIDGWVGRRRDVVAGVYPHLGNAAPVAAAALLDVL